MTGENPIQVSFEAHVELLQSFVVRRAEIVSAIQDVLNAQRKPNQYLQDRPLLSRLLADCFFTASGVTEDQARLKGELEEAHWASGFRPRQVPGLFSDLIHPAEMMIRGFYLWQRTRWPGRNGRVRYAQTLFNVYLLRCLELLSMRLWDTGPEDAGARLERLQSVLDELRRTTPPDLPALVRDARWLIPLAQSPTTDDLAAYFDVAERVAETLPERDRLEAQKAHVQMIAGHLRSQMRHYCLEDGVSLDDDSVVRRTRTSNALDFALLIQGLVPMLEAYEHASQHGDERRRFELAGAILQGISPDPELFLNRSDLLGPYSMMEDVFVATDDDGQADYTRRGQRHARLLDEYATLIDRLAKSLHDDVARFRPVAGTYSPYGAIFGTPTNLTEDMALKTLELDAETRFSLEDVFRDEDSETGRLAWVSGWRKLPHIDPEVQKRYEYPQQFAEEVFDRLERALRRCVDGDAKDRARAGRLFIVAGDDPSVDTRTANAGELPARYIVSSDARMVAADEAVACGQAQLLHGRKEGYFVSSFETTGGWVAIRKDFLTEVLGTGNDARIARLPPTAARVLSLMCLGLTAP